MYQFSETLSEALASNAKQRVLLEFFKRPDGTEYDPVVQFSDEDILISSGLRLSMEFNSETDLAIGLCPSAEIEFSMLNDNGQLEDFDFGTFRAYLGAAITSGTPEETAKTKTFTEKGESVLYEFAPLGTFIAQKPDIVRKAVIDVDANDQMVLFDEDMPDNTTLGFTYPVTLAGLASALCTYIGAELKTNEWLNSDITVSAKPEQFDNATMREVLGWIAEAGCSNARFTREGLLEFAWFNAVDKTYDEHDYTDFTPTWYETKAIDKLHIRNADSTAEYVYGSGDNAYMIQDNPFLRQAEPEPTTGTEAEP